MSIDLRLPPTSEDDALSRVLAFLRQRDQKHTRHDRGRISDQEDAFSLTSIIEEALTEARIEHQRTHPQQGMTSYRLDMYSGAGPFYDAAWDLCRRGVLRPAMHRPGVDPAVAASRFAVTPYGRRWLDQATGFECLPSEYGKFGQLLAGHGPRLGAGYHTRSQEALACYRAHTYLASCAMCGAAAESVLLALAIERAGDEATVLAEYRKARGRTVLEQRLAAGRNAHIQQSLTSYLELLKYWRDEAAHGGATEIDEEEAFAALLLLLRLARFADERWDELTARS